MLYRVIIWIMRFVLLAMIYVLLYKLIKVMYNDIKGGKEKKEFTAGIEVVEVNDESAIPLGALYPLRSVTNIGRTQDNSIVLDSQYASNYHARIYMKNNDYVLKDMNSTNGTYLNGVKVERPTVINSDDLIGIGGIFFKVVK